MLDDKPSTTDNPQEKLLLDLFYIGRLNEKETETYLSTLPNHFPYKGYSGIVVDDRKKAMELLKQHLGDFTLDEDDDYFPKYTTSHSPTVYLIQEKSDQPLHRVYNSKFNLEDLNKFLRLLIENGVRIYDYHFESEDDY